MNIAHQSLGIRTAILLAVTISPALAARNEAHVTRETPPTFIVHTVNDASVPVENSLLFAAALKQANVPFELHLYERGQHGFALGDGDPALSSWPARCADWLRLHGFTNRPAPFGPKTP